MAGNIKGITIEFRGDTTKLDSAMRRITSESRSVDQQLKEINRALRFNPRNVELIRQKFALLGQKVDATEAQLKEFRNIEKQLKGQGVSRQSPEWMKVRRNIIEAESKLKHFRAEMQRLKFANLSALGNKLKAVGQGFRTAGMYATIGGGAMVMAGKKLLGLTETQQQAEQKLVEIYKKRLGVDEQRAKKTMQVASAIQKEGVIGDEVTLSGAQQLATFAKMPGTIDKLLPAMDNLLVQQKGYKATAEDAQSMANLFGKAMNGQVGALKRVGISFTDAQAEILKTGTEEERAAVLAEVVTQNVGDMNEAFAQTDAGKIQQAKNALGDIGERLGAVLLPALGQFATMFTESILPKIETLVSYIEAHPILAKIAVAITGLLVVGGPLLIFIGALISAVGTVMGAVGALSGAFSFLLGPVGLVIAAIVAAIAIGVALYKNWDKIKAKAAQIAAVVVAKWNAMKAKVVAIATTIKTAVSNAFNTLKTKAATIFSAIARSMIAPIRGAVTVIKGIVNKIKGFFKFTTGTPHIKLPHFSISPPGWKLGDLLKGKKPSLGIKWYAQGGVFDSPTVAGIGEAGPEAVVPLDKFWKKLEGMSGGDNIVINVYGSDNMSVTELAAEVERRLIQSQNRRRLAWQ